MESGVLGLQAEGSRKIAPSRDFLFSPFVLGWTEAARTFQGFPSIDTKAIP